MTLKSSASLLLLLVSEAVSFSSSLSPRVFSLDFDAIVAISISTPGDVVALGTKTKISLQ